MSMADYERVVVTPVAVLRYWFESHFDQTEVKRPEQEGRIHAHGLPCSFKRKTEHNKRASDTK